MFDHIDDILHLPQEPRIDSSEGAQLAHCVVGAVVEGSSHSKDTLICGVTQLLQGGRVEVSDGK